MTGPKELIESIVIIVVALALAAVLHRIARWLLGGRRPRGPAPLGRVGTFLDYWNAPLRALIPALCVMVALQFTYFPVEVTQWVSVWLMAAAAWFCVRTVYLAGDLVVAHLGLTAKDNLHARRISTGVHILQRMLSAVVWFVAAAVILMAFKEVEHFGVSMLASAGVAGIIIGFAAQRSLGTILAGIQIAIAQPIRLDDLVIVEGESGWIEEINLTYVVVRIWDQRRLVLPVTYFINKPFQNWTRTTTELLGTVMLYADYTIPVQEVRHELEHILSETALWNHKAWALQVTDAKENTVQLRALMSADDSSSLWDLRCLVRERLLDFLQRRFPEHLPRTRVEMGPPAKM